MFIAFCFFSALLMSHTVIWCSSLPWQAQELILLVLHLWVKNFSTWLSIYNSLGFELSTWTPDCFLVDKLIHSLFQAFRMWGLRKKWWSGKTARGWGRGPSSSFSPYFFSCSLTSCCTPLSECLEQGNSYNVHIVWLVLDATGFPSCDLSLNW